MLYRSFKADCSFAARHGYPLPLPQPDDDFPRQQGIEIGDVGVVTADGSFDTFFNIRQVDDPVNCSGLPVGFEEVPLKPDDYRLWSSHFGPFLRDRGIELDDDDLYLVTGVDKSTLWNVSATKKTAADTQITLKLRATQIGSLASSYRWEWEDGGQFSDSGPRRPPGEASDLQNQTVFLRGFRISRRRPYFRKEKKTKVISVAESKSPEIFKAKGSSSGSSQQTHRSSGGTHNAYVTGGVLHEANTGDTNNTDSITVSHVPAPSKRYHPADAINAHMLASCDVSVAVTHDDEWMSVLEEEEEEVPEDAELIRRILLKYSIKVEFGMVVVVYFGFHLQMEGCASLKPRVTDPVTEPVHIGPSVASAEISAPETRPLTDFKETPPPYERFTFKPMDSASGHGERRSFEGSRKSPRLPEPGIGGDSGIGEDGWLCDFSFGPNGAFFVQSDSMWAWSDNNTLPEPLRLILEDPNHPQANKFPYDVAFPMEPGTWCMSWRTMKGEDYYEELFLGPKYTKLAEFMRNIAQNGEHCTRTVFGPNASYFTISPSGYSWQHLPPALENDIVGRIKKGTPTAVALGVHGSFVALYSNGDATFDVAQNYPAVDALIRNSAEVTRRKGIAFVALSPYAAGQYYVAYGDSSASWNIPTEWSVDVTTVPAVSPQLEGKRLRHHSQQNPGPRTSSFDTSGGSAGVGFDPGTLGNFDPSVLNGFDLSTLVQGLDPAGVVNGITAMFGND
ncbi:hypothetical protein MSAN_00553800 [Mycena sanguinolenta]|uniref:Uncharacterized protein n=1 Tax=Mycena sanguinolenta TaxID=230812 RepID=A0A8H6ZAQ0_9AGAR|nr:hypothetical protein MSAN_00553800 [Mycena sanguinolenta]